MDYQVLESQLLARISPLITADLSIVVLPESEKEKARSLPTKAKVTIIYAGSEYDETSSTGQNRNSETVFICLFIESTFLRGNIGIYNLVRVLKLAFSGFKPTNCQRLQLVKHHSIGVDPIKKNDNMWEYQLFFKTSALHVEEFIEDVSILVTQITLNSTGDQSVIT